MPTHIRAKRIAATRGQADDIRIAQGQIALIDAVNNYVSRFAKKCFSIFYK